MFGELVGYIIFAATMGYAKLKLSEDQANKWNEKLNAGKIATFLWTINLLTNFRVDVDAQAIEAP